MMAIIIKSVFDSKKIKDEIEAQLPFTVPFIWLTIGLFGMLPDVAWLPTAMILLITIFAWISGRLESFPLLMLSMFVALAIGFDSNFGGTGIVDGGELWDIISFSAFYGAIYALIINQMARTKLLYRFMNDSTMPLTIDEDVDFHYLVLLNNDTSKTLFLDFSKGLTIAGFLFSFTAVYGIGPIIGTLYLTYYIISDKYKNIFVFLPVLHILAFINFALQNDNLITETAFFQLSGLILIAEGLMLTLYSSKAEYGWEMFDWDDEEEFYSWLDNVGIIAMSYVVAGFIFAMQRIDTEELVWGLMAVYLSGIGLQGFREDTEAPWRRGFGTFGAIISLFFLSMEISTDIFRYMTWMFIGIVAFGFGIMYMNRLGEVSQLYDNVDYTNILPSDIEQGDVNLEDLSISKTNSE